MIFSIESDDFVRLAQSEELIRVWDGTPQTIVLGDLNALPGAIELSPILAAGFVDSWQEAGRGDGFTYSSSEPFKRIDWIWHTPDLVVQHIAVSDTTASDHLPVVVTIEPVH